ncbi:hypothetical protein [Streptomyces sp. R33]|uniref:Uncharacterized protein n=1 Tax=Streptomyces sp. R33 TaxID=3238629 RepID=A0AB39XVV0_9ACTN
MGTVDNPRRKSTSENGPSGSFQQSSWLLTHFDGQPEPRSSDCLSARLAQARRKERFPDLIDPLREVHIPPAWPDTGAFLRAAPDWFALDRTAGQATALYVACEKDTLRAQLTGWMERSGIPVLVVRGFGSQSYVQVVRECTARDERPAVLLYVGDFGDHADRPSAQLKRIEGRARHDSILSWNRVSTEPGAVQPGSCPTGGTEHRTGVQIGNQ